MKKECKRKKDCWHYWRGECKVLDSLVCEEGVCSFYEKPENYIKRQAEFDKKHPSIAPKRGPKY